MYHNQLRRINASSHQASIIITNPRPSISILHDTTLARCSCCLIIDHVHIVINHRSSFMIDHWSVNHWQNSRFRRSFSQSSLSVAMHVSSVSAIDPNAGLRAGSGFAVRPCPTLCASACIDIWCGQLGLWNKILCQLSGSARSAEQCFTKFNPLAQGTREPSTLW